MWLFLLYSYQVNGIRSFRVTIPYTFLFNCRSDCHKHTHNKYVFYFHLNYLYYSHGLCVTVQTYTTISITIAACPTIIRYVAYNLFVIDNFYSLDSHNLQTRNLSYYFLSHTTKELLVTPDLIADYIKQKQFCFLLDLCGRLDKPWC